MITIQADPKKSINRSFPIFSKSRNKVKVVLLKVENSRFYKYEIIKRKIIIFQIFKIR